MDLEREKEILAKDANRPTKRGVEKEVQTRKMSESTDENIQSKQWQQLDDRKNDKGLNKDVDIVVDTEARNH